MRKFKEAGEGNEHRLNQGSGVAHTQSLSEDSRNPHVMTCMHAGWIERNLYNIIEGPANLHCGREYFEER